MKSLNRYIREQRTLDASELITEGRIKNMSDVEWLNSLYGLGSNSWLSGNSGVYIQNIYDNKGVKRMYVFGDLDVVLIDYALNNLLEQAEDPENKDTE
jgi:hypothetical protein